MVRPDLHLPPSFLAWLAPFLAAFSRRTRGRFGIRVYAVLGISCNRWTADCPVRREE